MRVVGDICIPTVVLYPSEPDVNGAARPATGAVSIVYYLSWAMSPYVACIVVVCTAEHVTGWETGRMKIRLSSSPGPRVRGPTERHVNHYHTQGNSHSAQGEQDIFCMEKANEESKQFQKNVD